MILISSFVTQILKRFVIRKRPSMTQPARALTISVQRSNSLPSRVVILAPTLTYVMLVCFNDEKLTYLSILITTGVFFLAAMARVRLKP